ncbi:ATP-binding protein [Sciscionella sediminilitoris]|uniref:ATP-binding protein n=1 Tax=Sciscionella sediminilitoris TaxID=1445613 RepID=UPI0005640B39|nr:ATP-binding protein [Sciscionella sp. SE31]
MKHPPIAWDDAIVSPGADDLRVPPPAREFEENTGPPKLYRHRTGRIVGGVAGGVAEHLGVRVLWVRAVFAVLVALGGAGIAAYAMLWLFVRQESQDAPVHEDSGRGRQQAIALLVLACALAFALSDFAGVTVSRYGAPLIIVLAGAAVVWREADAAQRKRWASGVVGKGGTSGALRVAFGTLLVLGGLVLVLVNGRSLGLTQFVALAVVVALLGVAVLTLPWWLRMVRELGEERRARIRTEERAEIAAHLHDSVLQTLALIQKQSESPREVARLARGQERQLRTWLYGPDGYGRKSVPTEPGAAEGSEPDTLSAALEQAVSEVEDTFAIEVEQVAVGDCELDDRLRAAVQATREAMVNAAKHAGVRQVSLYAEVEDEAVALFVRDRGAGFDPDAVSEDRHGVADSIKGRMARNGGEARIRTGPGEGTEVQLRMPRAAVAGR